MEMEIRIYNFSLVGELILGNESPNTDAVRSIYTSEKFYLFYKYLFLTPRKS